MTRFTCSTNKCKASYQTQCKRGCCEVWECRSAKWWVHGSAAYCPDCSAAWPSAARDVKNWRAAAVKEGFERVCADCIRRNCSDLVCAVVPLVNGNGHGNDNCNGGNGGNGHGNVVNGGNGNAGNVVNGASSAACSSNGGNVGKPQLPPPQRPPPPPVPANHDCMMKTLSALSARIFELETWREDHVEAVEHRLLQLERWREEQLETFEERLLQLERWRSSVLPLPPPPIPLAPPQSPPPGGLPVVAFADLAANDDSGSSTQSSEESFTHVTGTQCVDLI